MPLWTCNGLRAMRFAISDAHFSYRSYRERRKAMLAKKQKATKNKARSSKPVTGLKETDKLTEKEVSKVVGGGTLPFRRLN